MFPFEAVNKVLNQLLCKAAAAEFRMKRCENGVVAFQKGRSHSWHPGLAAALNSATGFIWNVNQLIDVLA